MAFDRFLRLLHRRSDPRHGLKVYFSVSPKGRGVAGNDNKLSFAQPKLLQGLLVAKAVFARLHHQGKPGVDGLQSLLLQNARKQRVRSVQTIT